MAVQAIAQEERQRMNATIRAIADFILIDILVPSFRCEKHEFCLIDEMYYNA